MVLEASGNTKVVSKQRESQETNAINKNGRKSGLRETKRNYTSATCVSANWLAETS